MFRDFKLFKNFRKFSTIVNKSKTNSAITLLEKNNGIAWYPNNLISNIFKDNTGLLHSLENDEIGLVNSVGRKVANATQANNSLKPILHKFNNKYLLDFVNPNSVLTTECSGDKAANFILMTAGYTNKANNAIIAGCMEPTARSYLGINSNGYIGAGIDGVTYDTFHADIKWDIPHVVTLVRRNHTAYLRVDGVVVAESHLTTGGSKLNMYIGAVNNNNIADKHWNGKIGFVSGILSTMTDLEILLLEKFAAKKIGIII